MAQRTILIVDDASVVRHGIRSILELYSQEWVVCGECADGQEALAHVETLNPDAILLDISLPGTSGLLVAEQIRERNSKARIVIMSEQDPGTLELLTRNLGVLCVPKSRLAQQLVPTLREALSS